MEDKANFAQKQIVRHSDDPNQQEQQFGVLVLSTDDKSTRYEVTYWLDGAVRLDYKGSARQAKMFLGSGKPLTCKIYKITKQQTSLTTSRRQLVKSSRTTALMD